MRIGKFEAQMACTWAHPIKHRRLFRRPDTFAGIAHHRFIGFGIRICSARPYSLRCMSDFLPYIVNQDWVLWIGWHHRFYRASGVPGDGFNSMFMRNGMPR